jgi:hypothetical protein
LGSRNCSKNVLRKIVDETKLFGITHCFYISCTANYVIFILKMKLCIFNVKNKIKDSMYKKIIKDRGWWWLRVVGG